MTRTELDYTRSASSEGYTLTKTYDWFTDYSVMQPTIETSLSEVGATHNQRPVILGLGSGVGHLEREIVSSMEELGFSPTLFLTDLHPIQDGADTARVACDINRLPFPDGSIDLLVERSVSHYAPDKPSQRRLLEEARRVLRPGGSHIFIFPSFAHAAEAELLYQSHLLLPKRMNVMTREETIDLIAGVYQGKIRLADAQIDLPLEVTEDGFNQRYRPRPSEYRSFADYARAMLHHRSVLNQIRRNIACMDPDRIPNIKVHNGKFGWDIKYETLVCTK